MIRHAIIDLVLNDEFGFMIFYFTDHMHIGMYLPLI